MAEAVARISQHAQILNNMLDEYCDIVREEEVDGV